MKEKYIDLVRNLNRGQIKTYDIRTFGCQMNENDSEKIAGLLEAMGYVQAYNDETPDFIIFNTCCVRENAEQKVFGHLGVLKKKKEEKKDMIIALCGCMMQQAGTMEQIKKSYRHADIIFGTNQSQNLPEYLYNYLTIDGKQFIINEDETIIEGLPIVRESSIKAYVPIMYGCNNFCTYCVVPLVRGRERSRKPDDIVDEINRLVLQGVKEITLLGQNVNSYGDDFDFSDLLRYIDKKCDIKRVRFMTSHPKDISIKLIETIRDLDMLCNHLHLPIQSGSTKVLKEMNRKYTKDDFISIINKAKEIVGDIGLSTDIIIGFPGESDEDAEETIDVLKTCKFDFAYTFLYSKRRNTKAATRTDHIDKKTKGERFAKLVEVQNQITLDNNILNVGKIEKVLVEGPSRTNSEMLSGRTESNKIVIFQGDVESIGNVINVKITKASTWHLEGELI